MNTTDTLLQFAGAGAVLVLLTAPKLPAEFAHVFSPPGNKVGTLLLTNLLKAKIELAGVTVHEGSGGNELSNSIYLFLVSDRTKAIAAIMEALQQSRLLYLARIGGQDDPEGLFRCVHPAGGDPMWPDLGAIEADHEHTTALRLKLEDWLRLHPASE